MSEKEFPLTKYEFELDLSMKNNVEIEKKDVILKIRYIRGYLTRRRQSKHFLFFGLA